MAKQCMYCGRYFIPDKRVGERQKACQRDGCKRRRKKDAQKRWLYKNPGYFRNHYNDYVKDWRQKKKQELTSSFVKRDKIKDMKKGMIKDEIRPSKPLQKLILLIPADKSGMIKDEIRLRRVDGYTFAAYGCRYDSISR